LAQPIKHSSKQSSARFQLVQRQLSLLSEEFGIFWHFPDVLLANDTTVMLAYVTFLEHSSQGQQITIVQILKNIDVDVLPEELTSTEQLLEMALFGGECLGSLSTEPFEG
jgi:hypothetical protein